LHAASDHGLHARALFKLRARSAILTIEQRDQWLGWDGAAVSKTLTTAVLMLQAAPAAGSLCSAKNRQASLTK
jgi:hypothetical protein